MGDTGAHRHVRGSSWYWYTAAVVGVAVRLKAPPARAVSGDVATAWSTVTVNPAPIDITISLTSPVALTLGETITINGVAGAGLIGKSIRLVRGTTTMGAVTVPPSGIFSFSYAPTAVGAAQYRVISTSPSSSSLVMTFTVWSWFSLPSKSRYSTTTTAVVDGAPLDIANQFEGACTTFEASLGVDDTSTDGVQVSFETDLENADGIADFTTKNKGEAAEPISVDVTGTLSMVLSTTFFHPTLDRYTAYGHWGDARLFRSTKPS
ncbi:hypothetical protein BH09ACT4_BH09ACT4_25860 [soil metagenome]